MKIIIIDDDQIVCSSLKIILESDSNVEVVALGNDGNDAVNLYPIHQPDVLLMDIRMKQMTGIEAAAQILNHYPDAKILFLTTFSDDEYILEALNLGAKGYILKQDFANILPALKAIHNGQSVFGGDIINKLPSMLNPQKTLDLQAFNLLEKELPLIELVAEGLNNKEIAEKLCLSEGTIRNYLSTILEKLDLRDRTQLAIFYYKYLH